MPEIEYVDDEQSEIVEEIHELLAESDGRIYAVAISSVDGLNFLTKAEASPEELEETRLHLTGLLEHFDELVAAAKANTGDRGDADE